MELSAIIIDAGIALGIFMTLVIAAFNEPDRMKDVIRKRKADW